MLNRLARERVKHCGLADRITVICTEIARDQYMSQLVDFLSYYNARFDTVFSLIPSGDGLIQFVREGCDCDVDCQLSEEESCRVNSSEPLFHSWV